MLDRNGEVLPASPSEIRLDRLSFLIEVPPGQSWRVASGVRATIARQDGVASELGWWTSHERMDERTFRIHFNALLAPSCRHRVVVTLPLARRRRRIGDDADGDDADDADDDDDDPDAWETREATCLLDVVVVSNDRVARSLSGVLQSRAGRFAGRSARRAQALALLAVRGRTSASGAVARSSSASGSSSASTGLLPATASPSSQRRGSATRVAASTPPVQSPPPPAAATANASSSGVARRSAADAALPPRVVAAMMTPVASRVTTGPASPAWSSGAPVSVTRPPAAPPASAAATHSGRSARGVTEPVSARRTFEVSLPSHLRGQSHRRHEGGGTAGEGSREPACWGLVPDIATLHSSLTSLTRSPILELLDRSLTIPFLGAFCKRLQLMALPPSAADIRQWAERHAAIAHLEHAAEELQCASAAVWGVTLKLGADQRATLSFAGSDAVDPDAVHSGFLTWCSSGRLRPDITLDFIPFRGGSGDMMSRLQHQRVRLQVKSVDVERQSVTVDRLEESHDTAAHHRERDAIRGAGVVLEAPSQRTHRSLMAGLVAALFADLAWPTAMESTSAVASVLFPVPHRHVASAGATLRVARWFTDHLEDEQKNAVISCLARPPLHVIFGPPGTGKTTTVVELLHQCLHFRHARVLVVTGSNAAADLVTARLLRRELAMGILPESELYRQVMRFVGLTWTMSSLEQTFPQDSGDQMAVLATVPRMDGDLTPRLPTGDELAAASIVIATAATAARLLQLDERARSRFDFLVVDEASQITEAELLPPLLAVCGSRPHDESDAPTVVLAGDPRQLGPVIASSLAAACGMGVSLLERLVRTPISPLDEVEGRTTALVEMIRSAALMVPGTLPADVSELVSTAQGYVRSLDYDDVAEAWASTAALRDVDRDPRVTLLRASFRSTPGLTRLWSAITYENKVVPRRTTFTRIDSTRVARAISRRRPSGCQLCERLPEPDVALLEASLAAGRLEPHMMARMSSDVGKFVAQLLDRYPQGCCGAYRAARDMEAARAPLDVVVIGVVGSMSWEVGSDSPFNVVEVDAVDTLVRIMMESGVEASDMAVVTPYSRQTIKLRDVLNASDRPEIRVSSVEHIQGAEVPVAILSTVRSTATAITARELERRQAARRAARSHRDIDRHTLRASPAGHRAGAPGSGFAALLADDDDDDDNVFMEHDAAASSSSSSAAAAAAARRGVEVHSLSEDDAGADGDDDDLETSRVPDMVLLAQQRMHKTLGFLANPRRGNVAITRAQDLLVVVGDPGPLMDAEHWAGVLVYAAVRGTLLLAPGCEPLSLASHSARVLGDMRHELARRQAQLDARTAATMAASTPPSARREQTAPRSAVSASRTASSSAPRSASRSRRRRRRSSGSGGADGRGSRDVGDGGGPAAARAPALPLRVPVEICLSDRGCIVHIGITTVNRLARIADAAHMTTAVPVIVLLSRISSDEHGRAAIYNVDLPAMIHESEVLELVAFEAAPESVMLSATERGEDLRVVMEALTLLVGGARQVRSGSWASFARLAELVKMSPIDLWGLVRASPLFFSR